MSAAKMLLGSRIDLTTSALNSLANGAFVSAGTITFASSGKVPLSCKLEVEATPGTVSGNKQLLVYARVSMNGTNFSTGPVSGTTVTDEPNLVFVGALPLNTNTTLQLAQFDLASAFGGALPHSAQIVVKNETGASLAASGHAVRYTFIDGDIT